MALKKMKETPTGWGSGYTNIKSISCEKVSGITLKCSMLPITGIAEEFIGTSVSFMNVDDVEVSSRNVMASTRKDNLLACYVDSGVIVCRPEKELKK